MSKKIVIGITDCGKKHLNYENWIKKVPDEVDVIRLGHSFSNLEDVKKCHGILLTGGEDIHPSLYGSNEVHYANAPDYFEHDRDEFEKKVFGEAQNNKLPVLGICRGLQLINCLLGGTLKQDLSGLNEIHRRVSKEDKVHPVEVDQNTLLHRIVKTDAGKVNSSHHQAINNLGNDLKINCRAEDGTIEGIERMDLSKPFLMAVQWHPERMTDQHNSLSKNIRDYFIEESKKIQ
ncbi:MAG: Glutamine amidotransferase, class I [Cytophagales bacterium]|nr:gamma-glutamyl-gamma-aminobutyrate hydrolase family protein [Bacteroidota bacterium]MBS1980434.1 gamma-glutamyl-gamma-aminobutyrate hydrolase family protein [Bacteroidota bacterium]WHZ07749.1 MAG: Glutamine amidotransferase, class I [Cytophagales bacterium]